MNLNGIGILSETPLEELNVGCNRLSSLPLEVRIREHISFFTSHIAKLFAALVWFAKPFENALVRR